MNTVKNLNVNKKTNNFSKKLKVVVTTAAIIVVGALSFFVPGAIEAKEQQNFNTISSYYGGDTEEYKIVEYLKLSKILHDLNLDRYFAEEELFQKRNISNKLMSPDEIKTLVDLVVNEIDAVNMNEKNLGFLDCLVNDVLTLKKQETLVNDYIYSTGYNVANQNITASVKNYTAETFGIDDPNDIKFNFSESSSAGWTHVSMEVKAEDGDDKKYTFRENFPNSQERKIREAVEAMTDTNTDYDHDYSDNSSYNRERNKFIVNGLLSSIKLEKAVDEKDLYNESLAGKLR